MTDPRPSTSSNVNPSGLTRVPGTTIRFFISSTFADFQAERDVLQQQVFPKLRELCAASGFRLQPIDLRWGVSEAAGTDRQTLRICFDELEHCRRLSPDFFLLILLGERYGSYILPPQVPSALIQRLLPYLTPDEQERFASTYQRDENAVPAKYVLLRTEGPRDADDERLRQALARAAQLAGLTESERLLFEGSTTHREIQLGLLGAPRDAGQEAGVLCAVRAFAGERFGPAVATHTDKDAARGARERALTEAVLARLPAEQTLRYTIVWDGERGPVYDKQAQDALAAAYLGLFRPKLEAIMAARTAARQVAAVAGRDATALANTRFAALRTARFVGREDALAAIARELSATTDTSGSSEASERPLVITGPSGVGKSTLLAEAARRTAAAHPSAALLTRYIGITPGTSSLRDLLVGLRHEIAARYGQKPPAIPADDARLIAEFPAALSVATVERPLILILDALDQLGDAAQRVDWLPAKLPPHACVIVSVLPDRLELDTLRERLGEARILRLAALAPEEGAQLLGHWLTDAGRALQPVQREAVLQAFAAEGLPLYLRLSFEQARRWRSFDLTPALGPTVPALLGDLFTELARDDRHGPALVAHGLGDLAAAKNGLAEDEALDVLGRDATVSTDLHRLSPDSPPIDVARQLPLPVVLWARLYADLEPYLTEREADGAALITFYHRQVREAVEQRYLSAAEGVTRHAALAAYFGAQPLRLGERLNRRQLRELPYQQAHGEQWDALRTTLTDVSFLEGKLSDQGVSAVVDDLALAQRQLAQEDLQHLSAVIRAGTVTLSAHPDELMNQVRGRWGAIPTLHHLPTRPLPAFVLSSLSLRPKDDALISVFTGHTKDVRSCAFSPDGRLALSASSDHTLRLWEVASGQELRQFTGHTELVWSCAFSPDGRLALSASTDKTLRLWEVASGQEIRQFTGHSDWVHCCAFSPDGRLALSASSDHTLRLWEVASGQELRQFTGHASGVMGCAFSPDGRLALSASMDKTLRLWEVASGQVVRQFSGHTDWVEGCVFSPDGQYALSASNDKTLRLWEVASGQVLRQFSGHSESVNSCAYSPDGRYALSASSDATLRLWEVASGQELRQFTGHTSVVADCAFSPDGRLALSASHDTTLRLWEVTSGQVLRQFTGHASGVMGCAFSPDGRLALSASKDRTLRLWEVTSGQTRQVLEGHTSRVNACAFSPDGRLALSASGGWAGLSRISGPADPADYALRLWEVASGQELRQFTGHASGVMGCAFSPDGRLALSASMDKTLRLWEVASGQVVREFTGHTGEVASCAFSPDGRLALSASIDSTLRLWEVESGQEVRQFTGHSDWVHCCAFSPDGRLALSASMDKTLRLWEVASGQVVRQFSGHTDWVEGCVFSPDGQYALSASNDKTLRLWEVATGAQQAVWYGEADMHCCAFSPLGDRVMAGDAAGGVHLFEIVGLSASAPIAVPTAEPTDPAPATPAPQPAVVASAETPAEKEPNEKAKRRKWLGLF